MTTIILVVVLIVLFFVGLVCPHLAGKIQRKTDDKANWLKRMSNWFWDPVTWWAKGSIEWSRKGIDYAAEAGKKLNFKASKKKK